MKRAIVVIVLLLSGCSGDPEVIAKGMKDIVENCKGTSVLRAHFGKWDSYIEAHCEETK